MSPPQKLINLLRGWPAPDLLAAELLSSATARVLSDPAVFTPILEYGPSAGHPALREGMAAWLGRHYGVAPDPERICVTGGASQNLACIMQSFTDPVCTKAVWMVAPCYHLAAAIFDDAGFRGRLKAVPEDDEGVDLAVLEEKIQALEKEERGRAEDERPYKDPGPYRRFYRHIIYGVTTCSNPSGKTMSVSHREALVRLARKYDCLVISDDVYDFLQWSTGPEPPTRQRPPEMRLPRLCDIDRAMNKDGGPAAAAHGFGNTASNGSFSKLAGPGVRTGWAEGATAAFADGLSRTASTQSGGCPSQLVAAAMGELVRTGELEAFIEERVRPALQRRHRLMMETIREHIVPLGVDVRESSLPDAGIYGGYFVWFTPRDGLSSKLIAAVAQEEENLIIGAGHIFEVHGDEKSVQFDTQIRLCFSWEAEEDMVEGIRRLGRLLRRMKENRALYENRASDSSNEEFVHSYK